MAKVQEALPAAIPPQTARRGRLSLAVSGVLAKLGHRLDFAPDLEELASRRATSCSAALRQEAVLGTMLAAAVVARSALEESHSVDAAVGAETRLARLLGAHVPPDSLPFPPALARTVERTQGEILAFDAWRRRALIPGVLAPEKAVWEAERRLRRLIFRLAFTRSTLTGFAETRMRLTAPPE
jgi:hypothetical protein